MAAGKCAHALFESNCRRSEFEYEDEVELVGMATTHRPVLVCRNRGTADAEEETTENQSQSSTTSDACHALSSVQRMPTSVALRGKQCHEFTLRIVHAARHDFLQ